MSIIKKIFITLTTLFILSMVCYAGSKYYVDTNGVVHCSSMTVVDGVGNLVISTSTIITDDLTVNGTIYGNFIGIASTSTYSMDSDKWDGYQFDDYINQPVRTSDDVNFYKVTSDTNSINSKLEVNSIQWNTIDGYIDGEVIKDDTIDDDSLDFTNITLNDFTDDLIEDSSHTHTGATISNLDISDDTNLIAGTHITLTDDTLDIDDSFIKNYEDDLTNYRITVGSFTVINQGGINFQSQSLDGADIKNNEITSTQLADDIILNTLSGTTIYADNFIGVSSTSTYAYDSDKWDNNQFLDYLDQGVRTIDNVEFYKVTSDTNSINSKLEVNFIQWNTSDGYIDGEVIKDDTIDDDSLDFVDITLADFIDDLVEDSSHTHTGVTISGLDISDDTNLIAGNDITLSDDTLNVDDSFLRNDQDDSTNYNISVGSIVVTNVDGINFQNESLSGSYIKNNEITSTQLADDVSVSTLNAVAVYADNFIGTSSTATYAYDSDKWDNNQFADYINQPIRTNDEVNFYKANISTVNVNSQVLVNSIQWNTIDGYIDGEVIKDDTIDDDSLDFVDITLSDFTDDLGEDSGHTHTGSTISGLDVSDDTNLIAGNDITLTDDTLDVDDSFLRNDQDDVTNYSISVGSLVVTNQDGINFPSQSIDGVDIKNNEITSIQLDDDIILNTLSGTTVYADNFIGLTSTSTYSYDSDKLDGYHWSDIESVLVSTATYAYDSDKWDGYQFSDYVDQGIKTIDDVSFYKVTSDTNSINSKLEVNSIQWNTNDGYMDGEQIKDDTIDDDSLDFVDITLTDFTDDLGENPGHTHTTTSISGLDISDDTNLIGGNDITLSDDTLNVDDSFLRNDQDDTTNYQITVSSFIVVDDINLPSQSLNGSYIKNNEITSTQLADDIILDTLSGTTIYADNFIGLSSTSTYADNSDKLDGYHWSDIEGVVISTSNYANNSDKLDGNDWSDIESVIVSTSTYSMDSDKWDGYQFSDYINQSVRNIDEVNFYKVTSDTNSINSKLEVNSIQWNTYDGYIDGEVIKDDTIDDDSLDFVDITLNDFTDDLGENPGHTHTGTSISGIDISDDTNLVAGNDITLSDDTLNVDDSFLRNDQDDTTNYKITVGSFVVTNQNGISFPSESIDGSDIKNNEITSTQLADNVSVSTFSVNSIQWNTIDGYIDGEQIKDDTIDDDSLDFIDVTLNDFTDDLGEDSGHTHTGSTISGLDISDDTNLAAGNDITLSDDTLNVDDSFLRNDQDDTTNYKITVGSFVVTNTCGIGVSNPVEKLEVNGAIKISSTTTTTAGVIRWTGSYFEGYNGSDWVTFGGSGYKLNADDGDPINVVYVNADGEVGINTTDSKEALQVVGDFAVTESSTTTKYVYVRHDETNQYLDFIGTGGTADATLRLDLDETNNSPSLSSPTGTYILVNEDLSIPSGNKFYVDESSDTYIYESASNAMTVVTGDINSLYIGSSFVATYNNIDFAIQPTQKIYIDGGGNTYAYESSGDVFEIVAGGTPALRITASELGIPAGGKFYLDWSGNDYISQLGGDGTISIVTGGATSIYASYANSALCASGNTKISTFTDRTEVLSSNLEIDAGYRIYVDGGSDTYITERIGNHLAFYTGGNLGPEVGPSGDLSIQSGDALYLDSGVDTCIKQSSDNVINFYAAGGSVCTIQAGGLIMDSASTQIALPATARFYLDGWGGTTWIYEASDNVMDFVVSAGNAMRLTSSALTAYGDILYNSAQTRYYTVPGSAFNGKSETHDIFKYDGSFNPVNLTETIAYAPVNLPHGAIVTSVKIYYKRIDSSATGSVILGNVTLSNPASVGTMASITMTDTSGSWVSGEDTSISSATIDNTTYAYVLRCTLDANDQASVDIDMGSVVITYTITKPLP